MKKKIEHIEHNYCDVCPGKFVKYTTKTYEDAPTMFCTNCGEQLVPEGDLAINYSNKEQGKIDAMWRVMKCPSYKEAKTTPVWKLVLNQLFPEAMTIQALITRNRWNTRTQIEGNKQHDYECVYAKIENNTVSWELD